MFLQIILDNLPTILTIIVGSALVWKHIDKALKLMKELQELFTVVLGALADKKLTKKEIDNIVKESKDVGQALKTLFK